ncbi:hypothetical protein N7444_006857 [Penicillium canescens]|uniref:aldehyde dehydrogenase (NAD(+)) n=1 Tax=Penicillium arizonense TaxID=1835702 RepID=A0A1F5L1F1_PENAI|nr:hypothetical protein PENARI_c074G02166 [Penicillium arizonense]KAJ6050141.1 hypothetical protein N7444_006857 [Penicillium canescens]OGE47025.1 hypothetical protein PENARI_c074G02166 [Penicillium arizonense]
MTHSTTTESFETRLFVQGAYVDAQTPARFNCRSTVDGSIVTSNVHEAVQQDVDGAVTAARAAFPSWAAFPHEKRASILHKFADLLERDADKIAHLEAVCNVKPVKLFRGYELPQAVSIFRYYAGWCGKIHGESFPTSNGFLNIVQREPLGVCAAITAFNAPIMGMAMKAAPCLATGNTLIMKSSEKTPLSTLYLGMLANEAGLPPGVFNIISGGELAGSLLAKHMGIDQISFTGSVGVGKRIAQAASQSNLKRVALELGGKSPSIIFPDAKLDVAIPWCVNGVLVLSGQICFASSRVYVHESIKKQVVEQMKASFESMDKSFGDPLDEDVDFPPLVDQGHFDRVKGFIDRGKEEATLVTGGQAMFAKGHWMRPTIFVDPTPNAEISREEVFGPVVAIIGFTDEEEVISQANNTQFGLAGAVFTQDINRGIRIASAISSGTVGINCCGVLDTSVPFGGFKQSGLGRELGQDALAEYTQTKTITVNMTY